MNKNEHFNNLIDCINKNNINTDIINKIENLTDNEFTFRTDNKDIKDITNIDIANNSHLFNNLNKINKEKFINLNLKSKENVILSILYSINYNEFNLITNFNHFIDNLTTNILIEFNNLFKQNEYKKLITKKKLREIIENKEFDNDLFLMIMADYFDFNLIILNNRLFKNINKIQKRGTIIIFKDNEDIYNLDSLKEFEIIEEIKLRYSKQYKTYEAIKLKSINHYKLTDLQEICNNYDIVINPNKKLKKNLYEILTELFKF